jgi:hypothetical protein
MSEYPIHVRNWQRGLHQAAKTMFRFGLCSNFYQQILRKPFFTFLGDFFSTKKKLFLAEPILRLWHTKLIAQAVMALVCCKFAGDWLCMCTLACNPQSCPGIETQKMEIGKVTSISSPDCDLCCTSRSVTYNFWQATWTTLISESVRSPYFQKLQSKVYESKY